MAANRAAKQAGILIDQLLADARALCPIVHVEEYRPAEDETALQTLSQWCIRYSPWVASDAPDGILVEVTGCAHLFGGEEALAQDAYDRLSGFGLSPRIALAKTIGAAWGLSHYGSSSPIIIDSDQTAAALSPLPISALRVPQDVSDRLDHVGLKRIGALIGKPRAPFAARYGSGLITRLDQALGHSPESLSPIQPLPDYRSHQKFAEPIVLLDHILYGLKDLTTSLSTILNKNGYGTRRLALALYRVDGNVHALSVRTSALCQDPNHISRLFREKLETLKSDIDAGFGFDQMILSAYDTEVISSRQVALSHKIDKADREHFDSLMDRFGNRFGFEAITWFEPQDSHIPEHSERLRPITDNRTHEHDWQSFLHILQGDTYLGRPITLLPKPEPITALAEVPDGPPLRFEWRRKSHHIVKAQGPERIAPEWWGKATWQAEATRDYFQVEDSHGYRFWLFKQGLYERQEISRWYMHGLFA